jgi:hypothetical protein
MLGILVLSSCNRASKTKPPIVEGTVTKSSPTKIPDTPIPAATSTAIQLATATSELTIQPSPTAISIPQAEIWSTTIEDSYKLFYALGYSAEMYRTTDEYWAVTFYDPTSYYESDYWSWYGNSIYTFGEKLTDLVSSLSVTKNYLDFPVSGIDTRADKFFRRTLADLGFDDPTIDEIMDVMSSELASARKDLGTQLCYGQLGSGEYIAVWLEQSEWGYYWYSADISIDPICESIDGDADA